MEFGSFLWKIWNIWNMEVFFTKITATFQPLSLWRVFTKLWAQFMVWSNPGFSTSRIEGYLFDFPSRFPSRLRAQFRDQRGWKLGLKPGRTGCNLHQNFNCYPFRGQKFAFFGAKISGPKACKARNLGIRDGEDGYRVKQAAICTTILIVTLWSTPINSNLLGMEWNGID